MALRTGAILKQRYRIIGRLGLGGFGAVYLALDQESGWEVAIKENLNADPAAGRQFDREASLLRQLDHPHLPDVHDYFHVVGRGQYLVMQYIAGEDLADRLERRGPLPEAELLRWMRQIASALTYLHEQQPPIIHRDIKPANIRLTGKGEKATAMLVDFGLAKVYDPGLRTTIGARAITPGYSPPEQYGQTTTDARSDIYALGATLYHLLTDREPAESTMRLIRETLQPARMVNPAVSPRVSDAVEKAMALDPARRFQSVGAFMEALGIGLPPREEAGPPIALGMRPSAGDSPANQSEQPWPAATPLEPSPTATASAGESAAPERAVRRPLRRKDRLPWIPITLGAIVALATLLFGAFLTQRYWLDAPAATAAPVATETAVAEIAPTVMPTALPLPTATPTIAPSATDTPTAAPSPTIASTLPASPTPDPTIVSQIAATDVAATALAETLSTAAGLSNAVLPGSARDILLSENGDGELYQGYEHSDFQLIMSFEQLHRDYEEWTVGAIMRYDLPGAAGGSSEALVGLAFNVSSTGQWRLSTPDAQGQGGDLGFDPAATEALTIEIVGQGERGWLFVNNRFVSELDLSAGPNSGTLWLFADVPDAPAGESVTLLLTFRS